MFLLNEMSRMGEFPDPYDSNIGDLLPDAIGLFDGPQERRKKAFTLSLQQFSAITRSVGKKSLPQLTAGGGANCDGTYNIPVVPPHRNLSVSNDVPTNADRDSDLEDYECIQLLHEDGKRGL